MAFESLKRTPSSSLEEYALHEEKRRLFLKKYGLGFLFLGPYLFFFIVFFLYPLFKGAIISFYHYNIADPTDIFFRGFQNFQKILFSSNSTYFQSFWNGMKNTVIAVLILVPFSVVLPLLLAALVNVKPFGNKFFRAVLYLPSIFPITATAVIFLNMFNNNYGFLSALFGNNINWLLDAKYNWILIIVFCLWSGIGGNFLIFLAALQNVDPMLKEASSIDGCGPTKRFIYITLPQIKPQLILCFFTATIGYMNLYGQNYMLGSFVSDKKQIATAVYVIQDLMMGTDFQVYGMVSAMAISLGFFIMLISIAQLVATKERKGGSHHEREYLLAKRQG